MRSGYFDHIFVVEVTALFLFENMFENFLAKLLMPCYCNISSKQVFEPLRRQYFLATRTHKRQCLPPVHMALSNGRFCGAKRPRCAS